MANWNVLKAAVANIINANGNQEITGQLLQNVLNNIITNVGENATFAGIATLDTNPGAPDGPVFYLATTAGVYPNFNGLEVLDGEAIIFLWNNSAWTKKVTGFATQEKMQELEENTNEKLSQLEENTNEKLSQLGSKVKTVEVEPISEETEDSLLIEDEEGNVVVEITDKCVNVSEIKIKGDSVSKNVGFDSLENDDEEEVWENDDSTEQYVKIGEYGIKAKAYYDMDGNILFGNKIKICCFGDSLTYGAGASDINVTSYPAVLKNLIGEGCIVTNEGISGASCQQIMARIGSQPAFLSENVMVSKDAWVYSDYRLQNGEGYDIGNFNQGIPDGTVNPVIVNDMSIYLNTNGQLCRTISANEDTILKEGDMFIFNGCRRSVDADVLCLWMGTNGVYTSVEKLAEYCKGCVQSLGVTKYLILGITYIDEHNTLEKRKAEESYLSSIFGMHYINLRDYFAKYSLEDAGITPTENDLLLMSEGKTPDSVMGIWEQGIDRVHFNDVGYNLIAAQVYKRGKMLKYWI